MPLFETQLFSYSGWDVEGTKFAFFSPILKVQIGPWKAGFSFNRAIIDLVESTLTLYDNHTDYIYPLTIKVGHL